MKVFYDDDIFCRQKFGGISRYFSELIKYEISQNINVELLALLHKNDYLKQSYNGITFQVPDIKLSFQACKIINYLKRFYLLEDKRKNIYHGTYYSSFSRKSSLCTEFCTVYDLIEEEKLNKSGENHLLEYKNNIFSRCDCIISISNYTKNKLCEFYKIDDTRVKVIHLGVDHSIFRPGSSALNDHGNIPDAILEIPYILYVGQRSDYKNFRNLVCAMGSSNLLRTGVRLIAFGGGPFTQGELNWFKSCGLKSKNFLQVSGPDVLLATLYRNASCFVFPSELEGFGIPPLEAMASGCPVAVSNAASIPEVVGDAGLFFDPQNIDDMIDKIECLLDKPSVREAMVQKGFQRSAEFTWSNCGSRTLALYRVAAG